MTAFRYKGLASTGRNVAGVIDAASEKSALDLLSGSGIVPFALEADQAPAAKPGAAAAPPKVSGRVPLAVRTVFVRELATFLHADIPLLDALGVLRQQEVHPAFKAILSDVYDRVQSGDSFSKALMTYPKVFPNLLVSMVRVGETGGMLASVLEQMATWMEHEEEVRGEIRTALAYPLMILCLGIVTVIILLSFVLPRITSIFAGMETSLPLPTRILMGAAAIMARWWWAIPIGGIALTFGVRELLKTRSGRALWDRASLSVPIFGTLALKAGVSRFARASAALLSSGVPLLEALRVVRGLLGNTVLTAMVDQSIERVTKGETLAKTLGDSPFFPTSAIHLLSVGERTGRLSEMFGRVATTLEKQTRSQMKILLDLLSPLMIVALAVMVAMIAIAILLPIFQMNKMMR